MASSSFARIMRCDERSFKRGSHCSFARSLVSARKDSKQTRQSQIRIPTMSDFSIDYILNRAGARYFGTNTSMSIMQRLKLQSYAQAHIAHVRTDREVTIGPQHSDPTYEDAPMFDWLQYSRYHPPKLSRTLRAGPVKRTPGRLPRIPFSPAQLQALEGAYQNSNYLSAEEANSLAVSLELTSTRVKIWFQNRRARERREKREKEEESCESNARSSNASSPELKIDVDALS